MAVKNRVLKLSSALACVVVLSGCGYIFGDDGVFRDNSEDYKRAPETKVITNKVTPL